MFTGGKRGKEGEAVACMIPRIAGVYVEVFGALRNVCFDAVLGRVIIRDLI